jgi:hypothetical protein
LGGARLPGSCHHLKWRLLAALPPLEKAVGVFGFFLFSFWLFCFFSYFVFSQNYKCKI